MGNEILELEGRKYNLSLLKVLSKKIPIRILPLRDLVWIVNEDEFEENNIIDGDINISILVILNKDRNPFVISGVTELLKADLNKVRTVRVKWITEATLKLCLV